MIELFGIPNCDTVKKARNFLAEHQLAYDFIDFKKSPPTKAQIEAWTCFAGELPINKQGLTYRKHKEQFIGLNPASQIEFIIANPSMIKRPVLVKDGQVRALGFKVEAYQDLS